MVYSDRQSKLFGCGCMIVAALVSPFVLMLLLFPGPYNSAFPRPFDSSRWQKVEAWDDDVRCAMLADLRLRVGIEGKTRAELTELLGPPDDQRDEPTRSGWLLCPSFMDIWILEVRWQDNRVTDAWVRDT